MYIYTTLRKNRKLGPSISVELMESIRHGKIVRKRTVTHLGTLNVDDSQIPGEIGRFVGACVKRLQCVLNDEAEQMVSLKLQIKEKILSRLCVLRSTDTNIKAGEL